MSRWKLKKDVPRVCGRYDKKIRTHMHRSRKQQFNSNMFCCECISYAAVKNVFELPIKRKKKVS